MIELHETRPRLIRALELCATRRDRSKLGDGSVVTYAWYRFVDQPALQDADLSEAEKTRLQAIVEQIHAHWTPQKEYLPAPNTGSLATLDPALLVKPPRGLEVGYVPIVLRQSPR